MPSFKAIQQPSGKAGVKLGEEGKDSQWVFPLRRVHEESRTISDSPRVRSQSPYHSLTGSTILNECNRVIATINFRFARYSAQFHAGSIQQLRCVTFASHRLFGKVSFPLRFDHPVISKLIWPEKHSARAPPLAPPNGGSFAGSGLK
jgi:hypothetical protein